jgi:hypothetical protein
MSVELKQNNINHSDLREMYNNIGRTYEQPTNSFGEKAKKVGKIALGILFLISAFLSYPFNSSNKISNTFEQLTGPPSKESDSYEGVEDTISSSATMGLMYPILPPDLLVSTLKKPLSHSNEKTIYPLLSSSLISIKQK